MKAKLNSHQSLLDFLVSHEIKFKFNILYIIISVENSCGAQYFLVISFVTGINYILGKSYFKGCNMMSYDVISRFHFSLEGYKLIVHRWDP